MLTYRTIKSLTHCLRGYRASGLRVGFVPTMGFLHEGHRALIEESVARCDITVVSIFVNPTQFGPNEDLDRYPRALEADHEFCRTAGVSMIFVPDAGEIYPPGFQTTVEPGPWPTRCAAPSGPVTSAGWPPWSPSCSTSCSRMWPSSARRTSSNAP